MSKRGNSTGELLGLVDELGDLERELAPLKGKIARLAVVRAALREAVEGREPSESFTIEGERYTTLVGPCGVSSVADIAKLARILGMRRFLELASVSLSVIEKEAGAEVYAAVVTATPTGTRPLTAIPKAAKRRVA